MKDRAFNVRALAFRLTFEGQHRELPWVERALPPLGVITGLEARCRRRAEHGIAGTAGTGAIRVRLNGYAESAKGGAGSKFAGGCNGRGGGGPALGSRQQVIAGRAAARNTQARLQRVESYPIDVGSARVTKVAKAVAGRCQLTQPQLARLPATGAGTCVLPSPLSRQPSLHIQYFNLVALRAPAACHERMLLIACWRA